MNCMYDYYIKLARVIVNKVILFKEPGWRRKDEKFVGHVKEFNIKAAIGMRTMELHGYLK